MSNYYKLNTEKAETIEDIKEIIDALQITISKEVYDKQKNKDLWKKS
jgi:hypothetical protein